MKRHNARDGTLVSCPSLQLLGITLDCTLTVTDHVLDLCKKAGRSVNELSIDLDVKSFISVLCYGSF